jgi:hypothetical protein
MRNRERDERGRGQGRRPEDDDGGGGGAEERFARHGTDYGQPWAAGSGQGWSGRSGYSGQGYGRGSRGYGGFGHGPSWGEGVRPWEEMEGSGGSRSYQGDQYGNPQLAGGQAYGGRFEGQSRGSGHWPSFDDHEESFRRGFGMSPYGGYGQSGYGPGSQSGWGGSRDYGRPGQSGGPWSAGGGGWSPPQRGRAPKGYQRSDERIREDVCDAVIQAGIDAGEVDIRVEGAEVTLTGTVEHRYDKRQIEDIAESIAGVKDVHNQIRVSGAQRSSEPQSSSGLGSNSGAGTAAERERDQRRNGLTPGGPSATGSGSSGQNASR